MALGSLLSCSSFFRQSLNTCRANRTHFTNFQKIAQFQNLKSKHSFLHHSFHSLGTQDSKNPNVLECKSLTFHSINQLLKGNILAIRVSNYMAEDVCDLVTKKIFTREYEYYDYAKSVVGRYGMSFSEIGKSKDKFQEYYDRSIPEIQKIRSLFAPYISPIDRLRLELDEVWPEGAKLEQMHKKQKMFTGLVRVIDPHKIVLPHQDMITWDAYRCKIAHQILKQLATNIYLQIPEQGGNLELWSYGIKALKDYTKKAEGSYGINKKHLPPPSANLQPKKGELIIFNPQNLHCILPGTTHRLTHSSFLGYRGHDKPLSFWS